MNWLNNLRRTPAAKSSTRQPPNRPATPALDVDALRRALAAATEDPERPQRAEELGCALAGSLEPPRSDDVPGVWVAAVCHATDKAIALEWVAGVQGDAWLGEVAVRGRFAEVRLAAAQRIEDGAVLERVARHSRHKDNGVYRHCFDVVRQRRQAGERAQRVMQLALDLRSLLDCPPLSVSRLLDLQRDLHDLDDADEPLMECASLMEQANVRLKLESDARRDLKALQAEAESLAAQCSGATWPGAEPFDHWRERFSILAQAQAGLPGWLAAEAAAKFLAACLLQIESRLTTLAVDGASIELCEQFLAAAPAASASTDAAAAWEVLPKPEHALTRQALQARWQALQTAPAMPPPVAPERAAAPAPPLADLDAVRRVLEHLEHTLEQGHLAEAEAAAKQMKATVGTNTLRGNLDSRVQRAQARLAELRGWAQWGAAKKREQLIVAAEALLAGDQSVEHLAVAVPALREEWKGLNAQGPAPKGRWESFDSALRKAYQPVAAQRAQEAARRSQARADKEGLCAGWEAMVAAIDWEHADYAAIEADRHKMASQWRVVPQAGSRDERSLRKRFDRLVGSIDQRLDAARGAEVQRREQLIVAAEALREEPDLRRATTGAKALQERWRNEAGPLRLARGDEQKLWNRFRAACDGVFARRDAQRAELDAQREQRAQARRTLLDGFAATLTGADANEIKRALAQFRAGWEAARAGAHESVDSLERQARDLQQQAQQRIDALRRGTYRARLELMAQRAAPIEGVDAEALTAGCKAREALLIDLEIALALPTPDAYAPARRTRQLERLQRRFGGGPAQQPQAEELLARFYSTAALPDAALEKRIAAAVRKLIEQDAARG
jgi:DNA repair protein SbcC/Rad50